MNQCDGCRAGKPLVKLVDGEFVEASDGDVHVMGSLAPGEYPDLMGCERKLYESRQPFPVTDDLDDAPDGSVVELDGGRGWYERVGSTWHPLTPEEAASKLAEASTCSCDQRGRNISCPRCR